MGLALHRNGYKRGQDPEIFLLSNAQTPGSDNVAELESAACQLSLFDTLDDADSERYLLESLHDLGDGSSLKQAKDKQKASKYATRRPVLRRPRPRSMRMMQPMAPASLPGYAPHAARLRNPEMALQIARIMRDSKTSSVGANLLHLLGPNGLPQRLSQRGYQVEQYAEPR